jgi:hypothetical protein
MTPGKPMRPPFERLVNSVVECLQVKVSVNHRGIKNRYGANVVPPFARRGGRDITKNSAKLPLRERTGRWTKFK